MADRFQSLFRCVATSLAPHPGRPTEPRYQATCFLLVDGALNPARVAHLYSSDPAAFRVDADYVVDCAINVLGWKPAAPAAEPEPAPPPVTAIA